VNVWGKVKSEGWVFLAAYTAVKHTAPSKCCSDHFLAAYPAVKSATWQKSETSIFLAAYTAVKCDVVG